MQFNPKKKLTLYGNSGQKWREMGSRQVKRQQSHHYRIGTTDSYPYYGIKQRFVKVNRKARQLPKLSENPSHASKKSIPITTNQIPSKTYSNGFGLRTGIAENPGEEIIAPRAQQYNKMLGHQIRIEINQQRIEEEEMNTNPTESQNLLFYDFNSCARDYNFGGAANARLCTREDFRRTGMVGTKFLSNKIEPAANQKQTSKKRPITSQFRCGDRLPSRAIKTRDKSKRVRLGVKNSPKLPQQGSNKKSPFKKGLSPQHHFIANENKA